MHANTVFLLGLGLLLVVGRGSGYLVPEEGVEGKRSEAEEESIGRSDDLNRLELKDDDETLRDEDSLDPTSRAAAAAAAAAASGRPWYHGSAAAAAGAASRSSAAAAGAASRSSAASRAAAAAAAAAARMSNTQRGAAAAAAAGSSGSWDPWPSSLSIGLAAAARNGMKNEENLKENSEIARLAALKYMDDESPVRENDIGMRAEYENLMKNGEDDDLTGVMRDDPSLDLYYRYINYPLRQFEEEMQSIDEAVVQEPDSMNKRIVDSVRASVPEMYYRLLETFIRSDVPITRGSSAAAAAAASDWRSAAAAAAAAGRRRAAAAAAAAAARSAAAAAAASGWRSAARSAAAAAAAAGRRSPMAPFPTSYRLAANRSAAAAAAAAGRRSLAARSAAAAAAAASKRSAAAAAAAASGWRNLE